MTMAPSQLGMFARSSPEYATANLEFHVQPLSLDSFGDPLHTFPAITLSVCNLRPTSRGSIHAQKRRSARTRRSSSRTISRLSRTGASLLTSIRLVRRIAAAPALARYAPEELKPGAHIESEAELAQGGERDRHDDFPPGRHGEDGDRA